MTEPTDLERRYQRLLALYPRAFRDEHEQEMLTVLMAGSGDARAWPRVADSADVIRNALWTRIFPARPRPPRTVVWGIRFLIVCAALELAALATVVATQASLRAAIVLHFPHFTATQWHAVTQARVVPVVIGAPIAAALWLWLAWANGRGHRRARDLVVGLFGLTSLSLLSAIAQHVATYSPADLLAGCALWLAGLVSLILLFSAPSGEHYATPGRNRHVRRRPAPGPLEI